MNDIEQATFEGKLTVVQSLIESCPELVNLPNKDGLTLLMYAACHGHLEIIQYLLEHGGDHRQVDKQGWTALEWANSKGNEKCAEFLRSYAHQQDSAIELISFNWKEPRFDQLYVFTYEQIPHILHHAIFNQPTANASLQYQPIPASMIFLCARYAHYYANPELLFEFLDRSLNAIIHRIHLSASGVGCLAYWLTNCHQLLVFLKKDPGLLASTVTIQGKLAEMIHETFILIYLDIKDQVSNSIRHSLIQECKNEAIGVQLENGWNGVARRWFNSAPMSKGFSTLFPDEKDSTVYTNVPSLLSSTLYILQSNHVHPDIIQQLYRSLLGFVGVEIFNQLLECPAINCRTRAMLFLEKLSPLEEWLKQQANYFENMVELNSLIPVQQALSFLQVISSMNDLEAFLECQKMWFALSMPQIHAFMLNYTYEVNETHIRYDIRDYVKKIMQVLKDCGEDKITMKYSNSHELIVPVERSCKEWVGMQINPEIPASFLEHFQI